MSTRQRPTDPGALVGGEPARLVLDTLRTFPLSLGPTGDVRLRHTAIGETAEIFARAYEQVELQLITEAAQCSESGAHGTMHPDDYRFLVLSTMAEDAKTALGETGRVDGIWFPVEGRPHGADPNQDVRGSGSLDRDC